MKRILGCLLVMVLFSTHSIAMDLRNLNWMSEQYPPYNYVDDDGTPQGITFDVLMEMFNRLGQEVAPGDIEFLPWARSYNILQTEPGTALFSMTYTPERQALFEFVGPINPSVINVIAKKERNLAVSSPDDLDSLMIGVIRDDIGHQLLLAKGVNEGAIHPTSNTENMLRMLDSDRLDAIAYSTDIAYWYLARMGMDTTDYEPVHVLQEGHMGYAFHKDTDPEIIERLQAVLDELKAEGFVDQVIQGYLQ